MTLIATLASMSTMVNAIGPAFTAIGQTAMKMWTALKQFVSDKFIKPLKEKLGEIKEWWTGFKETVIEKWQGIKDFINDNVVTPIQEKWQGIKDFISDNVVDPIKEKWGTLKEWFTGFKATVIEKWTGIKNFINDNVIEPIKDKWSGITDTLSGIKNTIFGTFTTIKDFIVGKFRDIWDSIPTLSEVFNFDNWVDILPDWSWDDIIPDSLSSFFSLDNISTAFDTIGGAFSFALVPITDAINFIIDNLNSILGWDPKMIPGGSVGNILGIGLLDNIGVPQLAKGGIVNKPTLAMIGEDGPEAVVPLSQRNNPGGAGMGGGTYNITVNAGGITDRTDKRALAREIGNMIQQELARSIGGSTMRGRY